MHDAATALARLAAERSVHPETLAVAWVAQHPSRPLPVISARDTAQPALSLAAASFEMDYALYAEISALMPAQPPAMDRIEEQSA